MKKKLNANAIVLDLRRLTEETLSAYEDISLNAVITLTTPRAQALLSQYNVKLNTVLCKNLPDDADIRASVTNGKTTLSAASRCSSSTAKSPSCPTPPRPCASTKRWS